MLNLVSLLKISASYLSLISLRYYFYLSISVKFKISLYSLELQILPGDIQGIRTVQSILTYCMQSNYLTTLVLENFKLHSFKHLNEYNYISFARISEKLENNWTNTEPHKQKTNNPLTFAAKPLFHIFQYTVVCDSSRKMANNRFIAVELSLLSCPGKWYWYWYWSSTKL